MSQATAPNTAYQHALGVDHPNVAWSLSGLDEVFVEQGRLDEAKAHFTRALQLREKALGPDHPIARATRERLKALEG